MQILNSNKVVVDTFLELKDVLENENTYNYIYLGNDIILEEAITLNANKEKVIIDGTYLDTRHTYTVDLVGDSYVINATSSNKKVTIKNLDVSCCNIYGIVTFPTVADCIDCKLEYINVKYNGVQLAFNIKGALRIIDSIITIEDTNTVAAQEVAEISYVQVGGATTIINSSASYSAFNFNNSSASPYFEILPYSKVSITSENKEFMRGTTNLDFKVLHDAEFYLITHNGFGSTNFQGVMDALIDQRATFSFIEKGHQRIPMWNIYGTLTVNEDANFHVINTYESTPSDNYNIHFKGDACRFVLNKPNSVIIYTPNANTIYTKNSMQYSFRVNRVNKWTNSVTFTTAGDINNMPDFSWYKDEELVEIEGEITSTTTTVTSHNFTEIELASLPLLTDFTFQNSQQFSVGLGVINVHPIDSDQNIVAGHTLPFAEVQVTCNQVSKNVTADSDGKFECTLDDTITDESVIELISCVASSFIYTTREVLVPHTGELSIMEYSNPLVFSLTPISSSPLILPKRKDNTIKVVDSRLIGSEWKIYVKLAKPMTSENGFELTDAIVFKAFDDSITVLNVNPVLVFTGEDNQGNVIVNEITWSREKGILLNLDNNALEVNEEYIAVLSWNIEE